MSDLDRLKQQRQASIKATENGAPDRPCNPFFGVGPITDMTIDEMDSRRVQFEFDKWVEDNYPKLDDKGNKVGQFTTAELARGMHRGYPADKVLADMMGHIHRYFGFPKKNCMAVGLGGGHSGFTVCALHLTSTKDSSQNIFLDTPRPESEAGKAGGFFRQSWGTQLIEMQRYAAGGDESRLHFSETEGGIPTTQELVDMGIKVFFGVGHETTGATTYTEDEVKNLLSWIDLNPEEHHAIIDATSLLGAMPWAESVAMEVMDKCCMFMPFQKAIGGISGYFVISLTPHARALVDKNVNDPSWCIPRQLQIAIPSNGKAPLSSEKTTSLGPIFDAQKGQMLGGIINTYSTLAFAETSFGLLRSERRIGDISVMNKRSAENRKIVNDWANNTALFALGVDNAEKRGAAVTLLKVTDSEISDPSIHDRIILKSKQLLGYEGLTHPNGDYEKGLDVARYVNAFPGTPGDYRAWIGGVRTADDIRALLDNIEYCYHRAKIVVLEELLAEQGISFDAKQSMDINVRRDEADRAYKVLIADLVGMRFDKNGAPDFSEVQHYVETLGGEFHLASFDDEQDLTLGKIHFFYQPNLSTESEFLKHTTDNQYDAVIAAASFLPAASTFSLGGVRIGAGTGNMGSDSWGGGNGNGGVAPLMNTPSFNSRATAQMAIKALLKVCPDLPVDLMHKKVIAGDFDTGKNLCEYPTEKLEGKRMAVIGFGNIGREVAKLASAFGMSVVVHARPAHQQWIESEGFEYADSIHAAAKGSDVISPHTGLGPKNANSGKFANAGIIDASVLGTLKSGAIVINYDRGEVIDTEALDQALSSGQVRYAAIDADLFKNESTRELSGPMVPYLDLVKRHPDKMELLPHAAADTEHCSRVEGAKQAVDQIFDVIQYKKVVNLVGDLPDGYTHGGAKTVNCVGKLRASDVAQAVDQADQLNKLRSMAEEMASFWGAIEATSDPDLRQTLLSRYASEIILKSNTYRTLMESLGLHGPYQD